MALLTLAGKAAKHAYDNRNSKNEFAASASQNPEITALALAEAEKAKTRRSRNRWIGGILAGSLVVGGAGYVANRLFKAFEAGKPTPVTALAINNVLNRITLPASPILVQGDGSSAVGAHSRSESSWPVVGPVYNHTVANFTDVKASTKRSGSLQLIAQEHGISLKGVMLDKRWHVEADVDAQSIALQSADMHYALDSKGHPEIPSSADFLVRAFHGSVTGNAIAAVTQWADNSFVNNCAPILKPDLPRGVETFVQKELITVAGLETSMGHARNAALLRQLAHRSISVVFYQDVDNLHGGYRKLIVEPASIMFPERYVPKTAGGMHVFTDGGCLATEGAVQQQVDIQLAQAGSN